jgi:hypothetical protein
VLTLDTAVRLKPAEVSTLGAGLITPRAVVAPVNLGTSTGPLRTPKKTAQKKSTRKTSR